MLKPTLILEKHILNGFTNNKRILRFTIGVNIRSTVCSYSSNTVDVLKERFGDPGFKLMKKTSIGIILKPKETLQPEYRFLLINHRVFI